MKRPTDISWIPLSLLFLSLAAGCGRHASPTAVTLDRGDAATLLGRNDASAALAQGPAGFFPLTVGNRWHYARSFSLMIVPTGSEAGAPLVIRGQRDARVLGPRMAGGRQYIVEEDVTSDGDEAPVPAYIYWRQDRTGLYEGSPLNSARTAARAAFGAAWSRVEGAGGSLATRAAWSAVRQSLERKLALAVDLARGPRLSPGDGDPNPDPASTSELTRLRYPLHVGASWAVDPTPNPLTSHVEGMDVLSTAAGRFNGWRMRYDHLAYGPSDRLHVWYGDVGFLAWEAHFEGVLSDEEGNPLGTIIIEESERLDAIELVRPTGTDR